MFEPKFKTIPENLFNVVNEKINNKNFKNI